MTETTSQARTAEQLVTRARRAVEILRETLTEAPAGPWRAEWDSCDCGDGYGCRHGSFVTGIWFPDPIVDRDPDEKPWDYDRRGSTEIPAAAAQLACLMGPGTAGAVADLIERSVTAWDLTTGDDRHLFATTTLWIEPIVPLVDAILSVCCPHCLERWDVGGPSGYCCDATTPVEAGGTMEAGR